MQSLKYYADVLILSIIQYGMMSMKVDFTCIITSKFEYDVVYFLISLCVKSEIVKLYQ